MNFRLILWSMLAALPIAAAGFWASHASRMPEALANRQAMLEVTPAWDFAGWADVSAEPMHVLTRLVHLSALQVPGATVASVAWVNALLTLLVVVALCDVFRRTFPRLRACVPCAFAVFGMLAATPALGSNWLHGERLGQFAVPVLFVTALAWLQGEKRFGLRAFLAVLMAGLAPWFHLHGALLATALIPAMLGAGLRAGSKRRLAWIGALLLAGDLAAFFSMRTAPGISVAGADWFAALAAEPLETLRALMAATGSTWLDLLPGVPTDEELIGIAAWCMPPLLLVLGNRSTEARVAAAPWWSCWLFGLLLMLTAAVRHELAPPVGTLREATLGSYLLPIGMVGVLAARFGVSLLGVAAGALFVLALQDWRHGLEQLRVAMAQADRVEASLVLPDGAAAGEPALPVASPAELTLLQGRGWLPATNAMTGIDLGEAFAAAGGDDKGRILGGSTSSVRGVVRSSLRLASPQWVALLGSDGSSKPRLLGHDVPSFVGNGRNVPWQIDLQEPLVEGSRVRAVGLLVREHRMVPLGGSFVVRDGKLVAVAAGP